MNIKAAIREYGRKLGFSMVAFASAQPSPQLEAYLRWVKADMHGSMDWMARPDRIARRKDLNVVLSGAKTLVIVALDYATIELPADISNDPTRGRISNYAWGQDYHDVMLPQLEKLASYVNEITDGTIEYRAYVDTGAILERSHAAQAGIGFTGKNTMLINPKQGSYFFLGEIITTVEIEPVDPDLEKMPGCGTCTRCLSACPTNAFPEPYVLDARRCISYLTIEHKGFIPVEMRPLMGNWVYGCDVCQIVCPWQRFAQPTTWQDVFHPPDFDRAAPPLADLLTLSEEAFHQRFAGSPVKHIKRERLVRNACIAAGNSGLAKMADYLLQLLADDSPLIRGHAAWALGQLKEGHEVLRVARDRESNEDVRRELAHALDKF